MKLEKSADNVLKPSTSALFSTTIPLFACTN
jgi:hypothetical protein